MTTLPQWEWLHYGKIPYMHDVLSITENTIRFDGYFYIEDGAMPVERIVWNGEKLLHIEITSKKTGRNTSEYSTMDDDDGSGPYRVCFFPTAIITLTYRVLSELPTREYEAAAEARILAMESEIQARSQRCWEQRLIQSAKHDATEDTESEDEDETE